MTPDSLPESLPESLPDGLPDSLRALPGLPNLQGKRGLVVGIANDRSIAWGCARAFRAFGADDLAITYQTDKARPYVAPLADALGAGICRALDVRDDAEIDALFGEIAIRWGRLDFVVHSIAFAPRDDLQGRVTDCSRAGFLAAMDISCHSFLRLAKRAEPLMTDGGALFAMSYLGAERVVENYNLMGPVKAALEACVRALAVELGDQGIRVHAISPGPMPTRAASGLAGFDGLMARAGDATPGGRLAGVDDVGAICAFLATDAAHMMTGETLYIDGGLNIRAPV